MIVRPCRAWSLLAIAFAAILSSCVALSWQAPPSETANSSAFPKASSQAPIYFYISQYLTSGPSYSTHVFFTPPHLVYESLQQKIADQTEFEGAHFTMTPP